MCECERGLKFEMEHARNATSPSALKSTVAKLDGRDMQSNRRYVYFDEFLCSWKENGEYINYI